MSPFRMVDHTADIAVEIQGKDEREFFEEGIAALFFLYTDDRIENIQKKCCHVRKRIRLDLSDFDEGYIDFINRIITFVDVHGMLAVGVDARIRNKKAVMTVYFIEECSSLIKREIKAATRHNFRVERNEKGFESRITFDI